MGAAHPCTVKRLMDSAAPHEPALVLVADDDEDTRDTFCDLLRIEGISALPAADGWDAVQKAKHFRPMVIVMDLGMPGMAGGDAIRAIRNDPALRNTAILVLTGWTEAHQRDRALGAGADAFMLKPPDLDALLGIVRQMLLRNSRASSEPIPPASR